MGELFCLLVENSPEVLPPEWAAVADVIASEERLWVYPRATVAQREEEPPEAFMPFLNRKRLAEEWPPVCWSMPAGSTSASAPAPATATKAEPSASGRSGRAHWALSQGRVQRLAIGALTMGGAQRVGERRRVEAASWRLCLQSRTQIL